MFYTINYFTNDECTKIIQYSEKYKNYGFNLDWYKKIYNNDNRRKNKEINLQGYIIPNDSETNWIFEKIKKYFEETTKIKFLKDIDDIFLAKYSVGDVFPKHTDLTEKFPNRKYNIGIHLNDDYVGGEFKIWETQNVEEEPNIFPKKEGTIFVYQPHQLHEISKINKGIRWSIVKIIESDLLEIKKTLI